MRGKNGERKKMKKYNVNQFTNNFNFYDFVSFLKKEYPNNNVREHAIIGQYNQSVMVKYSSVLRGQFIYNRNIGELSLAAQPTMWGSLLCGIFWIAFTGNAQRRYLQTMQEVTEYYLDTLK